MTAGLNSELWLLPNWQAPAHIRAGTSWRRGGISQGPYASLNLALHVGDEADDAEVATLEDETEWWEPLE